MGAGASRNAIPRPVARRMGNSSTQNSASGSLRNSRTRIRVSWTSALVLWRGSFIAQIPSGHCYEYIFQGGRMGLERFERDTLADQLVENGGKRGMQLCDMHADFSAIIMHAVHA